MPSTQCNLKRDDETVCLATTNETEWLDHKSRQKRNKEDMSSTGVKATGKAVRIVVCLP